jgi:hypothetical protein
VPHFLLFLLDLKSPNILLEFPLLDAVVIFSVFQRYLGLFFQLSELIEVLEDQVLHTLFVDLNLYFMLLREILELSLLIAELSLFIFELLFTNDPKVVNSLTFILVETRQVLLLADLVLQGAAFKTERLLIVFIVDIVNSLSLLPGFFFDTTWSLLSLSLGLLWGHICFIY